MLVKLFHLVYAIVFYAIINIFKMLLALALLLTSLLDLHNTYGEDTWYHKTFEECEEIWKIKIHMWTVLLFTGSQALNMKKKS